MPWYIVGHGETITLDIGVSHCYETVRVKWVKRENINSELTEVIKDSRRQCNESNHNFTASLTIDSASTADLGVYNCFVGSKKSNDIELNVFECKFYSKNIFFNVNHTIFGH